jgi:hypothetical protein
MSDKEIGRLEVLEKILAKRLTQKSGAKELGLSRRQRSSPNFAVNSPQFSH